MRLARLQRVDEEIRAYYEIGEEAARLGSYFRIEEARTRELLERFLPPPPATILDVGGAAGAYALWLAGRGYDVHLIDPVPLHVEQAAAASRTAVRPLAGAEVGDARELRHRDAGVDAVLMLGPLYHLTEAADRMRALAEARRVLRPGAPLLAAGISRFAPLVDGLRGGALRDPAFEAIAEQDLRDGQHRNPMNNPRWFTSAYFHRPADLERELTEAGFSEVEVLAIEGLGGWLEGSSEWLDAEESRAVLLRTIRRTEREPSLLGVSPHLMAVGRA